MPTLAQALTESVARQRRATVRPRLELIDAVRGLACMMIVWHHLAFYGPMSDVVHRALPGLIDWLYQHGRLAVQVFLVIGGYMAAGTLAPGGEAVFSRPWPLLARRYTRLMRPYLVALACAVTVAALVRPWLPGDVVPAAPGAWQLLVHALLLQDLLGQEALSAGVWYVAIDFQLYALAVLVFALSRGAANKPATRAGAHLALAMLVGLVTASLLFFNRQAVFDATALYFVGAYGMGMLAYWAGRSTDPLRWSVLLWLLGALALWVEFRTRIAVAWVAALALAWASRHASWSVGPWLTTVGRMSYSVFLIHFPVCLGVGALVGHFWPQAPGINAAGMVTAFALSLVAGRVLYEQVESRNDLRDRLLRAVRRIWPMSPAAPHAMLVTYRRSAPAPDPRTRGT